MRLKPLQRRWVPAQDLPVTLLRLITKIMDEPRFLSGKLLLAMPGMADPRFERAVIAVCVHDENGAVGVANQSLTVRRL